MLKVTTLADGTQLQYLKVAHSLGPRWISHAESLLTTDRPEHALGMLPGEAMSLYWRLVGLGYKGLSLTNALPSGEGGLGQLIYTKTREDQQGVHIEFAETVTAANFVQACQTAIDLAKVECAAQKAVAICFVAQGLPVQVTEADSAETQLALWGRKMSSSVEQSDQSVLADKAFADYEFGEGVMVTDTSGWEYTTPGHERTRKVYVETEREDDGPAPRWVLNFTVRFDADSGALAEAYALDDKGQKWGCSPQGRYPGQEADLKVFEVVAAGFDGASDATDDLVFLVTAHSADVVREAIADTGAEFCGELQGWDLAEADYTLPAQSMGLSSALLEKASDYRNRNRPVAGIVG